MVSIACSLGTFPGHRLLEGHRLSHPHGQQRTTWDSLRVLLPQTGGLAEVDVAFLAGVHPRCGVPAPHLKGHASTWLTESTADVYTRKKCLIWEKVAKSLSRVKMDGARMVFSLDDALLAEGPESPVPSGAAEAPAEVTGEATNTVCGEAPGLPHKVANGAGPKGPSSHGRARPSKKDQVYKVHLLTASRARFRTC